MLKSIFFLWHTTYVPFVNGILSISMAVCLRSYTSHRGRCEQSVCRHALQEPLTSKLPKSGVISVPRNPGYRKFYSPTQIWFTFQLKFCLVTQLSPFSLFSSLKLPPNWKLGGEVQEISDLTSRLCSQRLFEWNVWNLEYTFSLKKKKNQQQLLWRVARFPG